jgi:hypothetical protein
MKSKVFFIPASVADGDGTISRKTEKIISQLGLEEWVEKDSFVGIKIHFGEEGNTGFIRPSWLLDVIKKLKKKSSRIFLTDSNTLYVGSRSNSAEHLQLANRHGFSQERLGIPVIIADGLIGRESDEIDLHLNRVKSAKIASIFPDTDVLLCLSHFTGHILTGFGAALKNLGMGGASRAGKLEQHSDVHPWVNPKICKNCSICLDYCPADAIEQKNGSTHIIEEKCVGCGECLVVCTAGAVKMRWDGDVIRIQEKMAEYAFAVTKSLRKGAGYVNFLLRLTKDCDCMSKKGKKIADDIGILGSLDPVAVDKASVDMVLESEGRDVLRDSYDVDWSVQLKHGEKIGLGHTEYELIGLK